MNRQVLTVLTPWLLVCLSACTSEPSPSISGQDVQLTLLHTTDVHSRLLPYDLQVGEVDLRLGLAQELEPFGGAARIAHVIERERGRSGRVLHVDSGDTYQGAPIFNFFRGEVEIRFLDMLGLDVMVMGNHEFDLGGTNLFNQLSGWAQYPVLAANYRWEDPELPYNSQLGSVSSPYTIMNVQGLTVAVIGLANLSSLNSIYDTNNRLGITPMDTIDICQYYVDFVRPQVDLVVVISHLGLTGDVELIENVSGMDVVLGGHHHVVLNPPRVLEDPTGRGVPNPHSGAFAKYVGRLDLVIRQCSRIPECVARYEALGETAPTNDWEVVTSRYQVFPIDSSIPEDQRMAEMLEDYEIEMASAIDLDQLVGYAPNMVRRFGVTGGDSQLGNLVATSMRERRGVGADFALTNTLGIRADFVPGPVSVEQMFNVFPFENTITTLNLSGSEVQEVFDFVAERSAGRGCSTQAQISGAAVVLDCGDVCPALHSNPDGSCDVHASEWTPRARRVLIDDASPIPSSDCQRMQEAYEECCEEVARCGCRDIDCIDSICEERARQTSDNCTDAYEPAYRTDPCSGDDECLARGSNQRCFIPIGSEYGRCMYAVVDEYELLDPYGAYQMAANDYIARGGSGFRVLGRNTSQNNLGIPLRDVLVDYIRAGQPCTDNDPCSTDADCANGQICACDAVAEWTGEGCSWDRRGGEGSPQCSGDSGRCILEACADDVARFRADRVMTCGNIQDVERRERCWCSQYRWALNECQELACIDEELGAVSDGRQTMVQP